MKTECTSEQSSVDSVLEKYKAWLSEQIISKTPELGFESLEEDFGFLAYQAGLEAGKPKWISVAKRSPEVKNKRYTWMESDRVIVRLDKDGEIYERFAKLSDNGWMIEGHNGKWDMYVTYWMPLPNPPEE